MNFTPKEFEVFKLEPNDILLNEGQSLELIGRPAIYRGELPGVCFTISSWNSVTDTKGPEIRVELYMNGPQAKQEFTLLESRRTEIESALGFPVVWHNPENKAICKVYCRQDADWLDESKWATFFAWLKSHLETMHRVFSPLMREVRDMVESR